MIYTLTCNPALDYVLRPDALCLGETNRSRTEQLYFGGKGINVSRVLRELGEETTVLGLIAGFTGDALEADLRAKGLSTDFVRLSRGLTRINVKLKGEQETEINGNGPALVEEEISALMAKLDQLQSGDTLVLAGSIPAGLPKNFYGQIAERLQGKGVRLAVDATGELLLSALPYRPFVIKPNRRELEEAVGRPLYSMMEWTDAAEELQKKGARNVLVSLGAEGAFLLDEEGNFYFCSAPEIQAVNTVGAGDSMLAGFLSGWSQGAEEALRLAVASGTATAGSQDLATLEDIKNILNEKLS